jgi:hypothetical protein
MEEKRCRACSEIVEASVPICPKCNRDVFRPIVHAPLPQPIQGAKGIRASESSVLINSEVKTAVSRAGQPVKDERLARIEELLAKSIQSTDRTTHAIRAFVRFLFIQLTTITLAVLCWNISLVLPEDAPVAALQFFAGAIYLGGIAYSSHQGWKELDASDIKKSY